MTSTLRPPPAFLTYASDDLAASRYYRLSAGERGLLASMNAAYWAEQGRGLPRQPILLARVTRLDMSEVEQFLTEAVLVHFVADPVDSDLLHSVELQRQARNVLATREKQSAGGQIGALLTNAARQAKRKARPAGKKPKENSASVDVAGTPASPPALPPASTPVGQPRVAEMNERTELQDRERSSGKQTGTTGQRDPWIVEYDQAEAEQCSAAQYRNRRG